MSTELEVGEGRRRYWTPQEKRQIVEQTLSSGLSVASVASEHGVKRESGLLLTRAIASDTAHDHGILRRNQGYTVTPATIVEESRMLQASIFQTVQSHIDEVDPWVLLLDVMGIADEVEAQLSQSSDKLPWGVSGASESAAATLAR